MPSQVAIPYTFVQEALDSLRRAGLPTGCVLQAAGIDPANTAPVSHDQYSRLWLRTAKALDDEFFGLAARPMRVGSFELMCQATLHAPRFDTALWRVLRFMNIVLEDPRARLRVTKGIATIALHDAGAARSAFAHRTYWLIVLGLVSWLVGRRIPLYEVRFACAKPDKSDEYAYFFDVPVRFACAENSVSFDASVLDLPVIRNQDALDKFLRRAPATLLVRYRQSQEYSESIRERLSAMPCADWPGFEDMARSLSLYPATLRRRLKLEGQAYQALKDEIRLKRARTLLNTSSATVEDVSRRLGYSEPSAFYRAYKKWTGQSPKRAVPGRA